MIRLDLVTDRNGVAWAQQMVKMYHYLHAPVDARSRPLVYIAHHHAAHGAAAAAGPRAIAILMFGRPEATRCYQGGLTYGSQDDVAAGRAQFDRWEVLNLARVWVHRYFQRGGLYYSAADGLPGFTDRRGVWRSTLASTLVTQALERVRLDYLLRWPPCHLTEPYQIRACLSYCDTRLHKGTLYKASGFSLARRNEEGIETYWKPLDELSQEADSQVRRRSEQDARAKQHRARRSPQALQEALEL